MREEEVQAVIFPEPQPTDANTKAGYTQLEAVREHKGDQPVTRNPSKSDLPARHSILRKSNRLSQFLGSQKKATAHTNIFEAVRRDSFDDVKKILKSGANTSCTEDGETPLHVAAREKLTRVAGLLLQFGADARVKNASGHNPFHVAAQTGNIEFIRLFTSKRPNMDGLVPPNRYLAAMKAIKALSLSDTTNQGETASHLALLGEHDEIVRELIPYIDSLARDNNGETPLSRAAQKQNLSMLQLLHKGTFDINARVNNEQSLIHIVAQVGNDAILRWLLEANANVSLPNSHGDTPLHVALRMGHLSTVKTLIKSGADPLARDANKHRPLEIAVSNGLDQLVAFFLFGDVIPVNLEGCMVPGQELHLKTLLRLGRNPNQVLLSGRTALMEAVFLENEAATRIILNSNADPNVRCRGDRPLDRLHEPPSALHIAVEKKNERLAYLLLSSGADVNISRKRETPLCVAMRVDSLDMISALLAAGARPNAQDNHESALVKAAREGRSAILKMFLGTEADLILALRTAAKFNQLDAIKVLLDAGASLQSIGDYNTELEIAAQLGDKDRVSVLVKKGVNPNKALDRVLIQENEEMTRILLAAGAQPIIPGKQGAVWVRLARTGDLRSVRTLCKAGFDSIRVFREAIRNDDLKIAVPMFEAGIISEKLPQIQSDMFEVCLKTMNNTLRQNMCNLENRHSGVEFISSFTVDRCIPLDLKYACCKWVEHLPKFLSGPVIEECKRFLMWHILHWFEAMSILRKPSEIIPMIFKLWKLLIRSPNPKVAKLGHDAYRYSLQNMQMIDFTPLTLYPTFTNLDPSKQSKEARDAITFMSIYSQSQPQVSGDWEPLLHQLHGHSDKVTSVSFSADGFRVASASCDKGIRIWDLATGTLLRLLEGHTEAVNSVVFSPKDEIIMSGSDDKTIRVWDSSTGASLHSLEGHTKPVTSVSFSVDGDEIASGSSDGTVRVWNTSTGVLIRVLEGHIGGISSIIFCSLDRIASGGEDMTVRIWDARNGALLQALEGHANRVSTIAFCPQHSIASGDDDGIVHVWDASTGEVLLTLKGHSEGVHSVTFGSRNRIFSGDAKGAVRVWDSATGTLLSTMNGHSGAVLSLSSSQDRSMIASGSSDMTARLWDLDSLSTEIAQSLRLAPSPRALTSLR